MEYLGWFYLLGFILSAIGFFVSQKDSTIQEYFFNVLVSYDQHVNTLLAGNPDETISSRCGKRIRRKEGCVLCGVICYLLNLIDENHCKEAIEEDEN